MLSLSAGLCTWALVAEHFVDRCRSSGGDGSFCSSWYVIWCDLHNTCDADKAEDKRENGARTKYGMKKWNENHETANVRRQRINEKLCKKDECSFVFTLSTTYNNSNVNLFLCAGEALLRHEATFEWVSLFFVSIRNDVECSREPFCICFRIAE